MSNIFVIPANCKYKWIEFDDDLYSMGLIFDIEHWLNTNCIGRWDSVSMPSVTLLNLVTPTI